MRDGVLVKLDTASRALAECKTVLEAKSIVDVAETARIYLERTKAGIDHVNRAVEIRLLAERQMGVFLSENPVNKGGQPMKRTGTKCAPVLSDDEPTLAEFGITKKQSARAKKFASVSESGFRKTIAETIANVGRLTVRFVTQAISVRPENKNKKDTALLEGMTTDLSKLEGQKFSCIYADPPWKFSNQGTRAATNNHYVTMSVDEICDLPIASLTTEQAHLHLWTPNAFLFECPKIFAAWGFEFKSSFVWVKPEMGIGNYWRNSHEILLLAVKGKLTARSKSEMSWLQCSRGPHSAKPEKIRESIERLSPAPYLELFGRRAVSNWTVFGNEVQKELV